MPRVTYWAWVFPPASLRGPCRQGADVADGPMEARLPQGGVHSQNASSPSEFCFLCLLWITPRIRRDRLNVGFSSCVHLQPLPQEGECCSWSQVGEAYARWSLASGTVGLAPTGLRHPSSCVFSPRAHPECLRRWEARRRTDSATPPYMYPTNRGLAK